MSDLIKQAEAARLRRVTPQAISDLVRRGKLKTKIIGDVPFVSRRAVLAFKPDSGGRPAIKKKAKAKA